MQKLIVADNERQVMWVAENDLEYQHNFSVDHSPLPRRMMNEYQDPANFGQVGESSKA